MSFAAVQKHVAVLERAGLVSKRRQGREQLVRGEVEVVRDAMRLLGELERQWRLRLDRFAALLGDPVEPIDPAGTGEPVVSAGPLDRPGSGDLVEPVEPPHRTDRTGEGARP